MESALAEIEFLALSPNRVAVLRCLAEDRHTRTDLAVVTGASQATLGRILRDFEERSWIERIDGAYVATATGELVADGFLDLLDIVETEGDLRPIVEYLPTDALDFDLRRFDDATITVPSGTKPNAPVGRVLDLLREASSVRAFSHAFNEDSLGVVEERVAAGELTFEGVFSRHAIDAVADDDRLRRRLESLLDAPAASIRVREAEIPLAVTVADEAVHLLLRDANGVLQASVDTDDPVVRDWAHDEFEAYWEAAEPLDHDDIGA
ncbi:helix-turn-helix transcriptional regulator [Haloplanus aerogenes]|uniref:ArsR family transcriptional regulator n=1 Tax=Haloplanus aerogenes TaxID=660522 RepID=A0A3M0DUH8_9EURY|nr:ArsR family transcriptional regulator [Haloplanus aerogenes]AZH25787.1 ArsR family transcriptional regulator [Haloplanus aerogenes]RMB25525.1 putative transcriptional regulator [Haloplanus aerogenes]